MNKPKLQLVPKLEEIILQEEFPDYKIVEYQKLKELNDFLEQIKEKINKLMEE